MNKSFHSTMSSACDSVHELLLPALMLPTHFEDQEDEADDVLLQQLALEMEIEVFSSLYAESDEEEEVCSEASFDAELEIRSLVQLPGNSSNSTVWVHTKTGRRAKIILEALDESENVGLLEYEDESQEIRRIDSYANDAATAPPAMPILLRADTPAIRRLDTLTIPNLGGARLPSMRHGKNPYFDPRESELTQSPHSFPNLPSHRAGKNPNFSPSGAVFF